MERKLQSTHSLQAALNLSVSYSIKDYCSSMGALVLQPMFAQLLLYSPSEMIQDLFHISAILFFHFLTHKAYAVVY